MTNYQKAIKVRKECKSRIHCNDCNKCKYYENCKNSNFFRLYFYTPVDENIETLSKVINEEKWNVK